MGRAALLPQFNEIFDALSKLVADPDLNVKSGAELLDRLLKDVVTESAAFDVTAFMPLLRERIYTRSSTSSTSSSSSSSSKRKWNGTGTCSRGSF